MLENTLKNYTVWENITPPAFREVECTIKALKML